MDMRRVEVVAGELEEVMMVSTPEEWEMAFTMVLAVYFRAKFQRGNLNDALTQHATNLREAIEDMEKRKVLTGENIEFKPEDF
jgi:hypothetical protein